ncbi:hypothetical protein F6S87_03635 [Bifidobacterium sp. BRDM6]|uniref:BPL/LPL catalytic domain-containing protein n=1 Tax=Bifidobacterium choloepi TaxID=2614131 RepID=A0A6I5N0Q9_9BIFI|nr:hypothetical protein [Bifidobacterium choloepi]
MPLTREVAGDVRWLASVDSTNRLAAQLAASGELNRVLPGKYAGNLNDSRVEAGPDDAAGRRPVAVIAAGEQTAGRGRLDHKWESRPGESFIVSFVTAVPRRLATDPGVAGWLQMIAGLATVDALREVLRVFPPQPRSSSPSSSFSSSSGCHEPVPGEPTRDIEQGMRLKLKWPNDIFAVETVGNGASEGRKLGGILAQMVSLDGVAAAGNAADGEPMVAIVFGIGLNLAIPADRLPTPQSTSLQLIAPAVAKFLEASSASHDSAAATAELTDRIAAGIVTRLDDLLHEFRRDTPGTVTRLLRRMTGEGAAASRDGVAEDAMTAGECWTIGREVEVHYVDGSAERGTAVGLNADASLQFRTADGQLKPVTTADVGVL